MNDDELEARLARWQPADAPPELLRGLRARVPTPRTVRWSWGLAYAALSTAWIVILVLWLLTPATESATNAPQTAKVAADASPPTSALAMERSFLLRTNPDQL